MDVELIYKNPNMGKLIEYAGRICYQSHNRIKEDSYQKFISGIVMSGHESVIEHSLLVFKIKNISNYMKDIAHIFMYSKLLNLSIMNTEIGFISGNLRMFKTLFREYIKECEENELIDQMIDIIQQELPMYMFIDMVNSGVFDEYDFVDTELTEEDIKPIKISDYITILQDNFDSIPTINNAHVDRELMKHATITYMVDEPRYISHQEVRHRMASYSQESQRYVRKNHCDFYVPDTIPDKLKPKFNDILHELHSIYCEMLDEEKIKPEDARIILPNAAMSKIIITRTYFNLFYEYIPVRADAHAQEFIRDKVAKTLLDYLSKKHKK